MTIRDLLKALSSYRMYATGRQADIRAVCVDSSADCSASVFVAIRGASRDGHDFIAQAAGKGAAAVVVQEGVLGRDTLRGLLKRWPAVAFIGVPDSRSAASRLCAKLNGYPSRHMHVCGITGTNGKTTLTYLIESLVRRAGGQPGVIGTVNYRFAGTVQPSKNTTPGPAVLQPLMRRMLAQGVDHLAMEVSSHALDQNRIEGVAFSSAIFTNLTRDHLDYHRTMEAYFSAKASLFRGLGRTAAAVINRDDPYGLKLSRMTRAAVTTYGLDPSADVWAGIERMDVGSTLCVVHARGRRYRVRLRLIGRHNVYNCLAVFAWGLTRGFKPALIIDALESFHGVPGRLERVGSRAVFVDYAHTEDALRNVLGTLRQVSRGRIITVFGCGGERDKGKRPLMGKAASELGDYCIITNDNPRREDPRQIIRDIVSGIPSAAAGRYAVVPDRGTAIAQGLKLAGKHDIVLVAGKGHEDYQVIGTNVSHFDDREVVRRCLRSVK